MSDFLFDFPDDLFHFAGFRQDFVAIAVNDPHEITPPACGLAAVRDSETGEALVCDFSAAHGATYRQTLMARRHALKDHLRSAGTDLIELDTQADCAEALTLFFHNRRRRAADETGG
jgi:uncharacterized protein (DUF58 family)